jgi:hypothetical protein
VEKDIGSNVLKQGAQCQNSRKVFTFGEWLKDQQLKEEARKLFTGAKNPFEKIAANQSSTRSLAP